MSTPDAEALLRERFGHEAFLPGQRAVVERLLAGRSTLAIFPTGGGKSVCYQLPSVVLDGVTVVVSPLIALMKDQVDAMHRAGVDAARLDSTLSRQEVLDVYDRLSDGRLRLLYVAPERLANERFVARLGQRRIALLAIDEAHCISQWGHNFRPDYLKLAELCRQLRVERVLALTATATRQVARDIREALGIADEDEVRTPFHRPNLHLRVIRTRRAERPARLLERMAATPAGPTIVYVTLQKTAEQVAEQLTRAGWPARAYHAGMKDDARHAVQDAFMGGACQVVVATIAFGMGIDKSDIRRVVHYNLPKTLESYTQEIGRAGRDGELSVCELLAVETDQVPLANFTYGDTPSESAMHALVGELLGLGERFDVSRYDLSARHDIRPLVVSTALTYLELDGVLASTGPFYSGARLRFLRPEEEVLDGLDERRRRYLRAVFDSGKRNRVWLTLDLAEAAAATDGDRERVVRALDWLHGKGWLEMQTDGLRHGYRRLRDVDRGEVAAELMQRFELRERQDTDRLAEVLAFVADTGCRTQHLLAHFDETLAGPCGHCSRCEGFDEGSPPPEPPPHIGPEARAHATRVVAEAHPCLGERRALARFLCGLTSPAASRARLGRHPSFGALSEHRFADVLTLADELLAAV